MASPNGLQRLQIYNDESSNSGATMAREHSGRLLNEEELDSNLLDNTMGFLLDNPSFGTIALPERTREMFNIKAAAERFPYTFDEMNEQLLDNLARGGSKWAQHREHRIELSEVKPDILHNSSPREEQNREMGGENEVGPHNSESPILIRGESADVKDGAESEDNPNPDAAVHESANPENVDAESNGHQSPEGSPVEDMVQTPEQASDDDQQPESPNNDETESDGDISQTGSGISINSRLRAHAFRKHLADYEFLPDHDCSNLNEFFEKAEPLFEII